MSQISQAKIKFVQSLKYKKYRQKHDSYVIEGTKACQTALQAGLEPKFVIFQNELPDFISPSLSSFEADERIMKQISSFDNPPDVICVCPMTNERHIEIESTKGNVILFLDRIQDPGNLGTIIRTADWYGAKSMILNLGCVDLFNPKTIQAAMGCHLNLNFYSMEVDETKKRLPNHLFVGLDMNGQTLQKDLFSANPIVLIVGNEGQGLSENIATQLDLTVKIPGHADRMSESLNAGISVAISLDRLLG